MTKRELATMYMPYYNVRAAVNRLMRWIRETPNLVPALQMTGYHNRQKTLTPQQVELIHQYLGTP